MFMMTSQILKFVDFTKTQKSRYLQNETLFLLQIKKSLTAHQWVIYGKKSFAAEVTFKECWIYTVIVLRKEDGTSFMLVDQ